MTAAIQIDRLGDVQIGALWQEILESIHEENGDEFPGHLDGSTLTIDPGGEDRAEELLRSAVEGCGIHGDREYSLALSRIVERLQRARAASIPVAPILGATEAQAAYDRAVAAWRADPHQGNEQAVREAHRVKVMAIDAAKVTS